MRILIKNATIVNEGAVFAGDVLIKHERIEKIAPAIGHHPGWEIIDASGLYLFPGMIDTHVHFREPGLTDRGTISTESRAAVAGGITSFMDMPNTYPNATRLDLLEEKYALAAQSARANYSFFFGVNANNYQELDRIDNETICGITDDGLYFSEGQSMLCNRPDILEEVLKNSSSLVALHCEREDLIAHNERMSRQQYGEEIPAKAHARIRSARACYAATKEVLSMAGRYNTRVHILHLSTGIETRLLSARADVRNKRITAEVCLHHLYFTDADYERKGMLIKWNPSIKTAADRQTLLEAVRTGLIDNIATDHAPHLLSEKNLPYQAAKSGAPSVQQAMPLVATLYQRGEISLTKMAELTSHQPAGLFRIKDRGYIREGYFADLVLMDLGTSQVVERQDVLYRCGWSPFEGETLGGRVVKTLVNGQVAYDNGRFPGICGGKRLFFEKER